MRSTYKSAIPKIPGSKPSKSASSIGAAASAENTINTLDAEMPSIEQGGPNNEPTADEVQQAIADTQKIQEYQDSGVQAFGEGLVRGVVPAGNVLLTKGFGLNPEDVSKREQYNPGSAILGETTGLVGGALLSGGETAIGKATIGGAAYVMEETAAKAIAGVLVGQGEKKLARRMAEKILEKGIPGAATGAAFGVNSLVNEAALGEADLTGENLLSYAGTGALLGGGIAGGLGAAGELARPIKIGVDKLTDQIKQRSKGVLDVADNFADLTSSSASKKTALKESLEAMKVDHSELTDLTREMDWGLTDSAKARNTKFEALKSKVVSSLDENYAKADKLVNGVINSDALAPQLKQSIDELLSKSKVQSTSREFMTAIRKAYAEIERIGQVGIKYGEKIKNADGTFTREAIRGPESRWNFSDLRKRTQQYGRTAATAANDAERLVNNTLNKKMREITQAGIDAVDQGSGNEGLLKQIKEANRKYSILKTIEDHGIAARADKHSDLLSMKDAVWGAMGIMHGGPLAGIGAVLSKKALESDMRKMFVVLGTAQKVNEIYAEKVSSGLKGFFESTAAQRSKIIPAAKNALVASGLAYKGKEQAKNDKEAFKNLTENLSEYRVNPDNLAMKIASSTMRAGYAAPNATNFARISIARAANFLEEKMPKDMKAGTALFGREYEPSNLELSKFKRYLQAIENPYSIMDELKQGTLTREHIEAVSTVFPAVYENIRKQALVYAQKAEKLPYSKKVQLSILFGIKTDSSLNGESVLNLQKGFTPAPASSPSGGGAVKQSSKGMENLGNAERAETGMQKASKGIQD